MVQLQQPPNFDDYKPLSELFVWQGNYNSGDVGLIYASIMEYGYNRTISVWKNNIVIAGNHTLKALKWIAKAYKAGQLDRDKDGNQILPDGNSLYLFEGNFYVQITDCSHLSEPLAKAYAIADNRAAKQAVEDESLLLQYLTETLQFSKDVNNERAFVATGYTSIEMEELREALERGNMGGGDTGNGSSGKSKPSGKKTAPDTPSGTTPNGSGQTIKLSVPLSPDTLELWKKVLGTDPARWDSGLFEIFEGLAE